MSGWAAIQRLTWYKNTELNNEGYLFRIMKELRNEVVKGRCYITILKEPRNMVNVDNESMEALQARLTVVEGKFE